MVKVRVSNPEYLRREIWRFEQPEYFEYEGQEVLGLKGTTPDELALTTGNPEWPVRVIKRSRILSIDGQAVSNKQTSAVTRVVKGSRGNEYVVTNANGLWHCTCPGFQFRRSCKHTA